MNSINPIVLWKQVTVADLFVLLREFEGDVRVVLGTITVDEKAVMLQSSTGLNIPGRST